MKRDLIEKQMSFITFVYDWYESVVTQWSDKHNAASANKLDRWRITDPVQKEMPLRVDTIFVLEETDFSTFHNLTVNNKQYKNVFSIYL